MTPEKGAVPIPDEPARRFAAQDVCFAGTCSTLYAGRDEASGRPVVVKVLRDDAFPSSADRARALRELQKLATVKHPACARIVAVGESDGRVWVARELVEGESLAERLARNGRMASAEAARVASQIAAALGELHRHGVLHRDLRPGHVLIEPAGAVRVIDAALGRVYRTPDGRATTGTPGYVSPESIAGKLVSFRSDLYSLGATLYEMLSGAPPFGTDGPSVLTAQLESDPAALRVAAPPALARLITSLLSREPRERPFSAQQVERQLEPMAFASEAEADPSSSTVVGSTEDAPGLLATGVDGDDDDDDADPTALSDAPAVIQEARRLSSTAATKPPAGASAVPAAHVTASMRAPGATPARVAAPAPGPITTTVGRGGAAMPPGASAGKPYGATAPSTALGDAGHKPTLMGITPLGAQGAAGPGGALAAARAAAASPAIPAATFRRIGEDSGSVPRPPVDDSSDDFDEAIDTVVQEDSRIFGLPEVGQASPHGTAVPPLPETVAAQVLTGSLRSQPSIQQPAASHNSGFTQIPTQPDAPHRRPAPGVDGPSAPQRSAHGFAPPPGPPLYPIGAPPGPPSGAMPYPGPPMAPGYPQPVYGATGGYPAANPQPGLPGNYPPMHGPRNGVQNTTMPLRSAGPLLDVRTLLPWVLAGLGIAGLAGAGGYFLATQRRAAQRPTNEVVPLSAPPAPATPTPTVVAPPVVPTPAPAAVPAHAVVAPAPAPRVVAPPPAPTAVAPAPATTVVVHHAVVSVHHETPLEHARALIAHRDYAGARVALTAALREQPNNAELHAAMGDVAVRLRELPTAIGEYRAAVRIAPRNTDYLHRLAGAQIAWNDRPSAVTTLRTILQINPRDTAAQNQLDQITRGPARPGTAPAGATGGNRGTTGTGRTTTGGYSNVPAFGPPPARTGSAPANNTSIFHR